jgi:hypothetical protein
MVAGIVKCITVKSILAAVLVGTVLVASAYAQAPVKLCLETTNTPTGQRDCFVISATNPLPVTPGGAVGAVGYPTGSTPITGNATGTTGAVVGTLAAATAKTTYMCGFSVSAIGGTAAVGPITIAGTITSSMVFQLASSAGGSFLTQAFSPCIPASALNTAITITTTADGTASAVDVNSWGFQL